MDSRWLTREETAGYVGAKEHQIRRMVREGKLPEPSLHLGPRSRRWDRDAIDALFMGGKPKSSHVREAVNASCKKERVVRRVLKNGTVREYRYLKDEPHSHFADDSVAALVAAYKLSPDYTRLSHNTKRNKGYYLRDIERLGDKPVMEVSRGDWYDLRDAIAAARGDGAANVFQKTLGVLLSWATERGKITHNVMAGSRQLEGGHLPAWTPAQADEACAKLPEVLRRCVILARYTGQRRGDLCAMMWSAYDGNSIKVKQQKTGAALVIPVHPVLKVELDNWRRGTQSTHILVSETGKPWKPQNLTQLWARGCRVSGCPES